MVNLSVDTVRNFLVVQAQGLKMSGVALNPSIFIMTTLRTRYTNNNDGTFIITAALPSVFYLLFVFYIGNRIY